MDFTLQMLIRLFILLLRPLEDMWTNALRLSDSLHNLCDHYIILLGFLQLLVWLGARFMQRMLTSSGKRCLFWWLTVRMSGIAKLASPYLCLAWRPCTVFGKCHWSFGMVCSGNSSACRSLSKRWRRSCFCQAFQENYWLEKKQDRVDLHNSTAAENGKPEPPDPSMSGDQYAEAIRNSKIQCRWCKRTRCLSVVGNFMTVPCHAPRVDELMGSLFLDGCDFFWLPMRRNECGIDLGSRPLVALQDAIPLCMVLPLASFCVGFGVTCLLILSRKLLNLVLTFWREGVAPAARALSLRLK